MLLNRASWLRKGADWMLGGFLWLELFAGLKNGCGARKSAARGYILASGRGKGLCGGRDCFDVCQGVRGSGRPRELAGEEDSLQAGSDWACGGHQLLSQVGGMVRHSDFYQ